MVAHAPLGFRSARRRFEDMPFFLPKDQQELNRLDSQHAVLRQVFRDSVLAPVQDLLHEGTVVLDVGISPSRWAFEREAPGETSLPSCLSCATAVSS
ncbi:hypothetical protein [Thermogemmatispora tikiterensis]|uniref:hypothetical protein n=1 Tax=Thermogemmatispora tikiterensis TaxID=1825093 RepID=UPI001CB899F9|nr:hypothetical protein [Thermogemmatispora tikiterensis]